MTGNPAPFSEQVLVSRRHGFAGTVDIVGWLNRQLAVVDFKTEVHPIAVGADWQTAAYAAMLLEMGENPPDASPVTFDAATHTYTLDGFVLPSVTQVLRRAGIPDYSHVPTTILEQAMARGTAVHKAIHYWNQHDLPPDFSERHPTLAGYLDAWITFVRESGFVPASLDDVRHPTHVTRYAVCLKRTGRYSVERFQHPSDYTEFLTLLAAQRLVDRRRTSRLEV